MPGYEVSILKTKLSSQWGALHFGVDFCPWRPTVEFPQIIDVQEYVTSRGVDGDVSGDRDLIRQNVGDGRKEDYQCN